MLPAPLLCMCNSVQVCCELVSGLLVTLRIIYLSAWFKLISQLHPAPSNDIHLSFELVWFAY